MADWPVNSIGPPSYGMTDDFYRAQVKSEFEAGYVQSRPTATRGRRLFQLEWSILSDSKFETMKSFVNSNMGSTFTMSHAVTGEYMNLRFSDGYLRSKIVAPGFRAVTISVEEA
jgi:hypothetical protein